MPVFRAYPETSSLENSDVFLIDRIGVGTLQVPATVITSGGGGGGSGTVTSVALSLPSIFSISGSPVTTSGTLTATLNSETANTVFAAPNGSAGTPTFRILNVNDLPASGVSAATYGDATHVAQVTVNAKGQVTGAANIAITGGGSSGQTPPLLSAYGPIDGGGVNTSQNDAAFSAAQADATNSCIYIPDGVYATTHIQSFLTKKYVGTGKISDSTDYMPSNFTYIPTTLTNANGTGDLHFWTGDTSHVTPEWFVIGPNAQRNLSSHYYEPGYFSHPSWYECYNGSTGTIAHAVAAASIGATSITFNSVTGLSIGNIYGLTPYSPGGTLTDTITITNIVGNVITFTPALTSNYPAVTPSASVPGYATIYQAPRTGSSPYYVRHIAQPAGGGDITAMFANGLNNYQTLPGQVHFLESNSVGILAGQIQVGAGCNGVYAQGIEIHYTDSSNDIATVANVQSFGRTNDTGALSTTWIGDYYQSVGSKPIDAGWSLGGPVRNGLDVTLADLEETAFVTSTATGTTIAVNSTNGAVPGDPVTCGSYSGTIVTIPTTTSITVTPSITGSLAVGAEVFYTSGGSAINMAFSQRIYLNSSASNTGRGGISTGQYPPLFGNTQGDMVIQTETDSGLDSIFIGFNGKGHGVSKIGIKINPTGVNFGGSIFSASSIQAHSGIGTVHDISGTGNPTYYFGGVGASVYMEWNGTNLLFTSNNGASFVTLA